MSASNYGTAAQVGVRETAGAPLQQASSSGWAAVTGGAAVATAVTVMLIALGSGIGLSSASPTDTGTNPSAATFTVLAAVWLIIVQWISSFFGGYLAGRLRPSLAVGTRRDEVFFRDTAIGFITWAVSSLIIVVLVTGGASSLLGGAGKAASSAVSSAAGGAAKSSGSNTGDPSGYLLDTLFRANTPNPQENTASAQSEAAAILATGATGDISQPDHDYLVQLVSARTGLAPDQAKQRVDEVISKENVAVERAKSAANAARKAAALFSIYTFFSMLVGAFIASVAGAIGGRQRDAY